MLHGTEPNTVGGLAHWIQTVYWESSSSDDTMWAACSSQNTNVPCESEKKEKKWVFHRNNLVNMVATQRENTCVLPKFWHGEGLITAGAIFGRVQIECCLYSDDETHPESGRKLQSQSQIRCEWTTENRRRWTAGRWDDSALTADTNTGWIVGMSLELRPEIVFKV